MNHQPFEEWLFSDEQLTVEQDQDLDRHLQSCTQCSDLQNAWDHVLIDIKFCPQEMPKNGFSQRFAARLEAEKEKSQRKWTLITLLTFLCGSFILSLPEMVERLRLLSSPVQFLTGLSNTIMVVTNQIDTACDVLRAVLGSVPLIVPLFIWSSIMISLLLWAFVWVVSVWRLPHAQRSTNL